MAGEPIGGAVARLQGPTDWSGSCPSHCPSLHSNVHDRKAGQRGSASPTLRGRQRPGCETREASTDSVVRGHVGAETGTRARRKHLSTAQQVRPPEGDCEVAVDAISMQALLDLLPPLRCLGVWLPFTSLHAAQTACRRKQSLLRPSVVMSPGPVAHFWLVVEPCWRRGGVQCCEMPSRFCKDGNATSRRGAREQRPRPR